MQKKDTGHRGEEQAAALLGEKGYAILERNWRAGKHEIDIIAWKAGVLVFAEVKTRGTREYGEPASFVTPRQRKSIIKAANFYISEKAPDHSEVRFDILSVLDYGAGMEIEHFEEAFYPMVNDIKL